MKTQKIINVLKFLKKHCTEDSDCKECKFRTRGLGCLLNVFPENYDMELIELRLKDIERIE